MNLDTQLELLTLASMSFLFLGGIAFGMFFEQWRTFRENRRREVTPCCDEFEGKVAAASDDLGEMGHVVHES
jgi:hypothetical protein